MEAKFVAYYRVSTKKQEESHLGLDAQRDTVLRYIKYNGNRIIAEYTEVESGRNNNRPELNRAIKLCQREGATLVIARLDRLSRSVTLISTLKDTGVDFICCDAPFADKSTILFLAVIAQREVELMSERVSDALQAKFRREPEYRKRHGRKKDGTINLTDEGRTKGLVTIMRNARCNKETRHAFHFIKPLRDQGVSYRKIAEMLNEAEYETRHGKKFAATQVRDIWNRFNEEEK